jgi:DNA-binding transcriptional MerR regulator
MLANLPDKQYFKIGEVARIAAVNCSVLRYWETEFDVLHPQKSRTGQRLYTQDDVQLILTIKRCLYEEKLTIAGARSKLLQLQAADRDQSAAGSQEAKQKIIEDIYRELKSLRDVL